VNVEADAEKDDEIVDALNDNICNCGTYLNIIRATKVASKS
jgi:aerobic-type carbon monoxide dehydrogenase small subunit (CoxS/CutS family)